MTNGIRFDVTANETLDRIARKKVQPVEAIPTPFPAWNAICGEEGGKKGMAKSWNIVVGGDTGTGKSYMALNLAAHAVLEGRLVGMINFEMTQQAVVTRYLSILTGIPKYQLEMGDHFSTGQWNAATMEVNDTYRERGGALISNESAVFTLQHIEESYAKLVDIGVEIIIVDYAQLVVVEGAGGIFARSEAVAMKLRELTHKYGVVTVAISQFHRQEARSGKPPTKHGLMGGGIWEHSADQIWLFNHTLRSRYGRKPNGAYSGEYTELLNDKNRHGMSPVVLPLKWDYETMRFDEYIPGTDRDDPFIEDDEVIEIDKPDYSTDTKELFDDEEEHAGKESG